VTQILANSIVYASEIAIIAVGVALSYSILRFANFAHVQFAVVGGYLTYTFAVLAGLPVILATAISMVLTGGLAVAIDRAVFRRLRAISPEGKMIVSWGVALFIRSILRTIHRLERDITVTRGLLNSSLVHPREVFREAIAERAAAIILVHNHPSGDPTPSPDDRVVTEQLVQAGKVLDIPVQDHVIIGRGRYISFAEAGLL